MERVTDITVRLFRVVVINTSVATTIEGVKLCLPHFEPQGHRLGEPWMRLLQDNTADGHVSSSGIPVNPSGRLFVNVVQKRLTNDPKDEIVLCYANPSLPRAIPAGRYTLTLRAEGSNVPPCPKQFVVDVDENGGLVFYPATNPGAAL